nr:discoidin domain-containing protein [Actinoplanes sp. NBRC 103695]
MSANCGGVVSTDLARGRPTTASSVESATYPATNAVDGNAGTRWSSQFADPQWIRVDLGSVRALNRVKLTWEGAYGRAYQIQTSTDGTAWTTAATVTNSDGGVDESTLSASARYVRVYGTQRATQWGYSLWDLNVYGA